MITRQQEKQMIQEMEEILWMIHSMHLMILNLNKCSFVFIEIMVCLVKSYMDLPSNMSIIYSCCWEGPCTKYYFFHAL